MDTENGTNPAADAPQGDDAQASDAPKKRRTGLLIVGVALVAVVTMGITALLVNILNRMYEAQDPYTKVVELDEGTYDPAVWGQNFPAQYEASLKTAEMGSSPSGHGGSKETAAPGDPRDPRDIVATSRIEEDPRLVVMWDGYPFSKDYRHARGHEYMLTDQRYTLRVLDFDQPGTCLNCHASTVPVMDELGNGDREAGYHAMNQMPYREVTEFAEHPVACIDCHAPDTMELRITRPAFERGYNAYMEYQGVEGYDVNRDATHQEMRTFVCAQCHVEYYFRSDNKELIFPWDNGMDIDDIFQTTKDNGHVDFVHARTGAEITKAQHPEFDMFWTQSVHATNGVSCADCHMPYQRDGARKLTDHHIGSPLMDVNASCLTCHTNTEEEMINQVINIQDEFIRSRDVAFDALVQLINALEAAINEGQTDEATLDAARAFQDKASFYLDYVYSENSYGFHAPAYAQRILNDSLDASRKGMLVLNGVDPETFEPSDVSQQNREVAKTRDN